MVALDALYLRCGEVVGSEVGVGPMAAQDMLEDRDEAVGHRDERLQAAAPPRQVAELRVLLG